MVQNLVCFSPPAKALVNRSAKLSCVLTYATLNSSLAIPFLTKWYAMELDFFFKTKKGFNLNGVTVKSENRS